MHTLVIADDEINQLEGLRDLVNWESVGFNVTAAFTDGAEVINYISNHPTDIVLTDIQMNCVSGLDVAEYVSNNCPGTSVVLISGYKEFEYAKKALDLGVVRYLVKPVLLEELTTVFADLRKELDIKKAQAIDEAQPLLWAQFFSEMVFGEARQIENSHLLELRLPFTAYSPAALLVLEIEDYQRFLQERWNYEQDRLIVALQNIVNNTEYVIPGGRLFAYLVLRQEHRFLIFLSALDGELNSAVKIYIDDAINKLQDLFSLKASYKLVLAVDRLSEINITAKTLEYFDFDAEKQKFKQSSEIETDGAADLQEKIISKAKKYISANYMKNISLNDVADHVFLSPVYFSRFFKQHTGANFIDYLTALRINEAVNLLSIGKLKIYEICTQVGYSNTKYFTRVFKSTTGFAPKDYKRKIMSV